MSQGILEKSLRRQFLRSLAGDRLSSSQGLTRVVTEAGLSTLPDTVQRYLRYMGVVGKPRDWSFTSRFVGRFRLRPDQDWMPCDAWQYNSAVDVARIFKMRIDLGGILPMFGTDSYVGGVGKMQGKMLGIIPVANGTGKQFDTSELVTYLNDALMLAPSMLLNRSTSWSPVDEHSFDVSLTDRERTVTARVLLDDEGKMIDFSTQDRYADLPGGLVRARWTTPVDGWTSVNGRPVPTGGRAIWHLEDGPYAYAEGRFIPETLEFNVSPATILAKSRGIEA